MEFERSALVSLIVGTGVLDCPFYHDLTHRSRVVCRRLRLLSSAYSRSAVSTVAKTIFNCFRLGCKLFARHRFARSSNNGGREAQTSSPQPTQKGHLLVSFALCCTALIDATLKKINKIKGVTFLRRFHVHP